VAALVQQLERQGVLVDLQYRSSTEAVTALARGECDLAGFHLPIGELETAAALAEMESAEFKSTLPGLPGYDGALSGQRLALQSLF
jgi:hypothetical protein